MITDTLLTVLVTYGGFGVILFVLFFHTLQSYAPDRRYSSVQF